MLKLETDCHLTRARFFEKLFLWASFGLSEGNHHFESAWTVTSSGVWLRDELAPIRPEWRGHVRPESGRSTRGGQETEIGRQRLCAFTSLAAFKRLRREWWGPQSYYCLNAPSVRTAFLDRLFNYWAPWAVIRRRRAGGPAASALQIWIFHHCFVLFLSR